MTDTISNHDFEELQKFNEFIKLVTDRMIYAKMNNIYMDEHDNARVLDECYKAVYGKG